ncbi:uncharacterized protein BROUX77_003778 [Berkeleyomyces rouxiae]|uniref:uncharacterized protein n=1 Tax=Berkeleyomyces rouxiae TaxID=2035830 RepID=UPI003B7836AF
MDSGLPEGWESDYDGKRWLYRYKATGAVQYRWPQPGDEYPDFVDSGIDAMEPEDRLATQQQSRSRKANVNETRKPHDSRMSATAGPVSFYNNEEFGNIEFFQPDALMYMGPGAYTDISPMGAEDIEQPLPDNVAELPNMPMGARVSPIASEKSTPKTTNANLNNSHQGQENIIDGGFFISVAELPHTAPVAELSSMSTASLPATNMIQPPPPPPPPRPRPVEYDFPMLDGREIQSATNRFASVSDPVGFMAEMATEFTGLSQEELDPVEMGDYRVLAPAEKAACIVPDIPELPSNFSSERMNLKDEEDAHKKKIQAQQRPYGDRQYPFQPRDDVIDPISIPSQSQPSLKSDKWSLFSFSEPDRTFDQSPTAT